MKRYIKPIIIILIVGSLIGIVPKRMVSFRAKQSDVAGGMPQSDPALERGLSPDEELARQTVVSFLAWYKNHIQEANRIPLVNQTEGEPYSVNLENGERYLRYLKSSHLLTDAYLNNWITYFKERQEAFRQSPQSEGPPMGFDFDLVMLTQDVDMQLAELETVKMDEVSVINDEAMLDFTLLDSYKFRLVRQNRRWLINEIVNQTQE